MPNSIDFLTPRIFDVLVVVVIVVGAILAARRIRADFRSGPRFPEDQPREEIKATGEPGEAKDSEKSL